MVAQSIVRYARPEDRQEIWRLFLHAHRENGMFSLAPEKVDWFLNRALFPGLIPNWDTGIRGAVGVIGDVGELEALVLVCLGSMWYSNDRYLEEYIIFVDPECRRSFHARALIRWLKGRSEQTRLPLLTGPVSNIRTEAKISLYSRMLPKAGEYFVYRPGMVELSSASCAA